LRRPDRHRSVPARRRIRSLADSPHAAYSSDSARGGVGMRKTHRVVVNGREFVANRGDVLLDAALMNGVHIPHDCRSGHCGTCNVHVVAGDLFGGGDARDVKACQCRIVADVEVAAEDVPDVTTVNGRVTAVTPLSPDVVAVRIAPQDAVEYL